MERHRRAIDAGILLALAAALVHLFVKAGGGDTLHADFNWIWLAGRVWASGGDPYGAQYFRDMAALFPPGTSTGVAWVYPPHWWALAVALGRFDITTGLKVWNTLNVLFIFAGVALWWRTAVTLNWPLGWRLAAALLVYVSFLTGTGSAFIVGQTGFLVFASVALLAFAIARDSLWIGALAVAALTLKPQVGLVFLMTLAVQPRYWKMTIAGLLLAGVAAAPGVATVGPLEALRGFLANLGHYRDIPYNLPAAMTGIGSLLAAAQHDASAMGLTLLAGAFSAALFWWAGRGIEADDRLGRLRMFFVVTLSCVACFVGMHIYDLIVVSALLLFVPALRPVAAGTAVVGLLLLLRPENLARAIGGAASMPPMLAAVGGVCLFLAALMQVVALSARRR